jgi:hypothetical protein
VQAIKAAASEGNAAAVEAIREAFGTSVSTGVSTSETGENEDDPF